MRKICTIIQFTTSVWPFVWGWKVVDLVSFLFSRDQRLDQNLLRNWLYRSDMMVCGIPKMYPHSIEEELGNSLCCDALLAGDQNHHLGKSINHPKNIVISLLRGRKSQHVVHGDGFPGPFKSRQRGVHALFLNGYFGNGVGRVRPDILVDILTDFRPIEMLMKHCYCLLYAEVSCLSTVVSFPNQLCSLA
jgi:hypothetical protein